jgi:hypothetical protein
MAAKRKRKLQKLGGRVTSLAAFLDLRDAEQTFPSCARYWPPPYESDGLQRA